MYTCILCRHGEVHNPQQVFYGRTLNVPLNDAGRAQIFSVAEHIVNLKLKIAKIYTSPLLRTCQSAEILAKRLGAPIVINDDLVEVDIPALVGKSNLLRKEIHARGIDEYSDEWVKNGNEAKEAIVKRMVRAFGEIKLENENKIPLIVGHGDPLMLLLYFLENLDQPIPSVGKLLELRYGIKKGSGVLLRFNEEGKIVEKKI